MSSTITTTVLLVNLVCVLLLYLVASATMTTLMRKSTMENLHASLKVQTEITKEYIRHQEHMLTIYSDSDVVREFLKNPQDEQKRIAAQEYTERYYNRLDNWEGLYISEWNSHTIAHSSPHAIDLVTREGEYLVELQNAMLSRNGLYNAGIIVSPASGQLILSQYCPVYDDDGTTILGYVGGGPRAEELKNFLASAKNSGAATYYLINVASSVYIFAKEESLMATKIEDPMLLDVIRMLEQDRNLQYGEIEYVDEEAGNSISAYRYITEHGWALVACNSEANIYADVNQNMVVLALICIAFELCIVIASRMCILYNTRPMQHIRDAITQLQELKLEKNPALDQYINTSSEIGEIATAIDSLYDSIKDMLQAEKEKQAVIAAGESKARFLASMSHEIRTPINTIVGMNEMILRENQDGIIHEYALNIKRESQLLLGLVNDVLDFSKIEAGKLKIVEKVYEPAFMLYDTILAMMPRIREKKLGVVREIDPTIPRWLKGDEIRVRQIVNNLLSNAVKYTEKGTITFHAEGEYRGDTYWLTISIADTGIGIKQEEMELVFESFKRLELDKTHYIEGTGLGLNITKQLVENMGGTIRVESEYGAGSRFTVILPQSPVTESEIPEQDVAQGENNYLYAPDVRILAIDDNKMNLTVLKALLKRSKIQIDTATNGMECLEMSKRKKYDLFLMDHMMPGMDGVQTMHAVREDSGNPNVETPMLVLTANAVAGMEEIYQSEGFAGCLTKPIDIERLEEMIAKHLRKE